MRTARTLVYPLLVILLVLEIVHRVPIPLKQVLIVLFMSVLLAATIAPIADALQQRLRVPRGATVLFVYLTALLALAGIVALIVPLVSNEVQLLRERLPQYDAELQRLVERLAPGQGGNVATSTLADRAVAELGGEFGRLTGFAVSLSSAVVRVVLVLVLSYYLAVEKDFAERLVTRFVPRPHRPRLHRLLAIIGNHLGHWARAQILIALSFGVAFAVGLRVIGVPYAVTLGVVGGVLEIIPYVGGFLTVILAVLVTATQGVWVILAVVVWYTVVVQVEAHVAAPYLMGRAVGLRPLVVVVALFIGAESLGLFGALLAVPIAVVLQALLDEFYAAEREPGPAEGGGEG